MRRKKVAIIGANGFLGLAISKELSEQGYEVIGFVRNKNAKYISLFKSLKIKVIVVGDLEVQKKIDLLGNSFNYVINLAARAHINKKLSNKGDDFIKKLSNIERNLVSSFDTKNVKLIQLSSAKVKLNKKNSFISDNELVYSKAKLASEKVIKNNFKKYIILRPPLIYGPNVKANFLSLIKMIDKGIPLPFKNLQNARSYLYLDKLVDLILKIIKEDKFFNKYYYVSDGGYVSTKHLTDLIAKYLSKKPVYFNINSHLLEFLAKVLNKKNLLQKVVGNFKVKNNELKKDIGWEPKYNLELGVKNTCFWYKTMFKIQT
jgi:nucleoside-diphosphate-sugar epimerase